MNQFFSRLMQIVKPSWPALAVVAGVFSIALLLFRTLVLNLATHLLDWNDYPYYVWTIGQNVQHITHGQLDGFFNTNSFYPHQGTLLFSDVLLPQSLIATFWQLFIGAYSQQPILIFNLTFLTGILLNIAGAYMLTRQLFSSYSVRFLATLTLALSTFFFLQFGHLQMVSFWPGLLALSLLLQKTDSKENTATVKNSIGRFICIGLLLSLQFYASVYLTIFYLTAIALFFLAQFQAVYEKKKWLLQTMPLVVIMAVVFAVLAGPLLIKYKTVQDAYGIGITYSEYVYYAAHLTDYIFFRPNTVASLVLERWNAFNLHFGGEPVKNPSLILSVLALIGIFTLKTFKKEVLFGVQRSTLHIFFLLLLFAGFLFSLGPRLNVNGTFVNIPLPYQVLVKQLPIMEPIRATNRWYFLFYLGVWYFAMLATEKLGKKWSRSLVVTSVAVVFLIEIAPLSINASTKAYYPDSYQAVAQICQQQPQVLLEFPITPVRENLSLIEYLQYRTNALLASVHHKCNIVNGYSGLTPKEYEVYDQELFAAVQKKDVRMFTSFLQAGGVDLIKFNAQQYNPVLANQVRTWLKEDSAFTVLSETTDTVVAKVN